ncbi:MAG: class D sortase [Ruminococcus sp.]|nr:class D sortase [Ruminococcus sp.]
MSDKKRRHRHKNSDGKSFIILPIIFLVGTYLVFYLALAPTFGSLVSAVGVFFSDNDKDFSTEYENIYVPVSENSTIPTIVIDDKNSQSDDGEGSGNSNSKKVYLDNEAIEYPVYSNMFGELIIEDCGIDTNLFFGDGDVSLRNGVGVYGGSFIPGYGKTILVAGHNNTYFNGLKYAEKGQKVVIKTSYGNYEYEITDTAVKEMTDGSAYDLSADYENLIMYTCYPFDELGLTSKRYFVYAKYLTGPPIDTRVKEG